MLLTLSEVHNWPMRLCVSTEMTRITFNARECQTIGMAGESQFVAGEKVEFRPQKELATSSLPFLPVNGPRDEVNYADQP
jgi:hypothetical protein